MARRGRRCRAGGRCQRVVRSVPAELTDGGYPYGMARPESHLRSASRPAPVRGVKHDRDDHLATDTPTTDAPASDTPTADAPVGDQQATGDPTPDAPSTDPSPPDSRPGGTPTAGPPPTAHRLCGDRPPTCSGHRANRYDLELARLGRLLRPPGRHRLPG